MEGGEVERGHRLEGEITSRLGIPFIVRKGDTIYRTTELIRDKRESAKEEINSA